MHLPAKESDIGKGAPSASTAECFPEDQLLRWHGWQIYARPKRGPALWRKGERIVPHEQALAIVHHPDDELNARVSCIALAVTVNSL